MHTAFGQTCLGGWKQTQRSNKLLSPPSQHLAGCLLCLTPHSQAAHMQLPETELNIHHRLCRGSIQLLEPLSLPCLQECQPHTKHTGSAGCQLHWVAVKLCQYLPEVGEQSNSRRVGSRGGPDGTTQCWGVRSGWKDRSGLWRQQALCWGLSLS